MLRVVSNNSSIPYEGLLKFKKVTEFPWASRAVSWKLLFEVLCRSVLVLLTYYREPRKSCFCKGKTEIE